MNVHHFNDLGVSELHIARGSWFTRLRVEVNGRVGKLKVDFVPSIYLFHLYSNLLQNVHLQCVCQKMYSPVLDYQRYCQQCEKWYHGECMEKIGKPSLVKGASALECLLKVPVIRGWDKDPEPQDWMTVGCGRKLLAVQRLKAKVTAESEGDVEREWTIWGTKLSGEFISYVQETRFRRFLCPGCSSHI